MLPPRAIALLIFFGLVGPAQPQRALAAASAQTPSKGEAAKAHYLKGVQLYKQGDYAGAWLEFTSAYQLLPRPELLFNMARCEARMGRPADAVANYQAYLQAVPDDPEAEAIRREIATLKVEAERQQRLDEERRVQQAEIQRPPEERRRTPFPRYGAIAGGGTLLAGIIAAALLGSVDAQYNALKADCGSHCLPEQVHPLQQQATAGYIFLGLTAAGAVTTAALLTWELRRRPGERPRTSALVPLARGLGLSWRF
jgi:tetratricopeptide (TPR) repeat protein